MYKQDANINNWSRKVAWKARRIHEIFYVWSHYIYLLFSIINFIYSIINFSPLFLLLILSIRNLICFQCHAWEKCRGFISSSTYLREQFIYKTRRYTRLYLTRKIWALGRPLIIFSRFLVRGKIREGSILLLLLLCTASVTE